MQSIPISKALSRVIHGKTMIVEAPVLYETDYPVLFSFYADGAFEKYYQNWSLKYFRIHTNGLMLFMPDKSSNEVYLKHVLHLSLFKLTSIEIEDSNADTLANKIGIKVECRREDENGLNTNFRCIMRRIDLIDFCIAARQVSKIENISSFLKSLNVSNEEYAARPSIRINMKDAESNMGVSSTIIEEVEDPISDMRAVLHVGKIFDLHHKKNLKSRMLVRRGAFGYLPPLFSNDLVHGSWWFVWGSIFITVVSIVVLITTYKDTIIGHDDSVLDTRRFREEWILLAISGFLFILGSVAFVRAMNDPPIKPLFKWYHISTDELLGSWLFFFGLIPAIPYSIIFYTATSSLVYLALLLAAILCLLATYLFVRACYPSTSSERRSRILHFYEWCFGRSDFMHRHCATDWLFGTWILFWGTLVAALVTFLVSIYGIVYKTNNVASFVNISR